jgi:tRNA (cmo5U34)-methyltransferase
LKSAFQGLTIFINMTDQSYREASKKKLEPMADFFTARLNGYEAHMTKDGYDEAYRKFAELVPVTTKTLLDLGCGTGLELDEIFKRLPDISVTGIDLTSAMLEKLKQKHPGKNLNLICGDYFKVEFGRNIYDTTISYDTLHHFTHDRKTELYRKVKQALKPGGIYIECDYMVDEQAKEDELFRENARVRREHNVPEGELYHFDTPCTVDNQIGMLKRAGFSSVRFVYRFGIDAVITASS